MVTETDRLAEAIAVSGQLWPDPDHDREAPLRRVIQRDIDAVESESHNRLKNRPAAIRPSAGIFSGAYPSDGRETLRGDGP